MAPDRPGDRQPGRQETIYIIDLHGKVIWSALSCPPGLPTMAGASHEFRVPHSRTERGFLSKAFEKSFLKNMLPVVRKKFSVGKKLFGHMKWLAFVGRKI